MANCSIDCLGDPTAAPIKNIEAGRDTSPATLRSLIAVRELALPEELVAQHQPEAAQPNAWYAPGFAPVAEFHRMLQVLQGQGGTIEQTYLYYDHPSALDWLQIAAQPDYADAHRVMPLDRAAEAIHRATGERGMDVIALGPGTGHLETRLVALIARQRQHPAIRFYLLDISQPLLAEAYRHAANTLACFEGVSPIAIQGNFHGLPQFGQILYVAPSASRRQIICMLGGTFANLDHELRFVRDALCGFGAGTLLLLDFPVCLAPASHPGEIRRRDPWLSGAGRASAWRERVMAFWSGPLRRYVPGVEGIEIRVELDLSGSSVPGSYAVEARARVRVAGAEEREFSVFRIARHDPACLARAPCACSGGQGSLLRPALLPLTADRIRAHSRHGHSVRPDRLHSSSAPRMLIQRPFFEPVRDPVALLSHHEDRTRVPHTSINL
jgi:hypothetical protein